MNLFPNEEYRSTYEIPFPSFYKEGYRGVIFDIDNTLVPHGFPADEKAIQLFLELKRLGFATCLVSNNKKERVASFAEEVGADYIFKAGKPSRIQKIRYSASETRYLPILGEHAELACIPFW